MPPSEFKRRRKQLMGMMGPQSIAIVPAALEVIRNRDVHYPYRQSSDFYYLTGFAEPDALAVLVPGRKAAEYILFCRPRDEAKELWDGARAGLEGARKAFGADDAFPIEDLDDILPGLLEPCARVYYPIGSQPELDRRLVGWVNGIRANSRAGIAGPLELVALDHYLHELRLYKGRSELGAMRAAARISVAAHKRVMRAAHPGLWEYQLEAEFIHECVRRGGRTQAYPPIVGSGANACVLHYVDNGHPLREGDLVLVDAGCEYQYYASDITRTFPVCGEFNEAQKALYEVVLSAQLAAIAKAVPGNHWQDPHTAAVEALTRGLVELGILKGTHRSVPKLIREEKYKPFYMHRTGHWLGMDVHDVGDYKVDGEWRLLEPGMALTIEPGLYVPAGSEGVPERYCNTGIRIEDDLVVTESGHEILTEGAPKTVSEIEAWMAG
jgi:Xaa-Pro aminopeptidase